jgi:hypothetical protein
MFYVAMAVSMIVAWFLSDFIVSKFKIQHKILSIGVGIILYISFYVIGLAAYDYFVGNDRFDKTSKSLIGNIISRNSSLEIISVKNISMKDDLAIYEIFVNDKNKNQLRIFVCESKSIDKIVTVECKIK